MKKYDEINAARIVQNPVYHLSREMDYTKKEGRGSVCIKSVIPSNPCSASGILL